MKYSKVLSAVVLAVAVLATSVILGACSGGGGGGTAAQQPAPKVQLSGTISGTGYNHKSLMAVSLPTPTIDKVLAIPMDRGSLNSWGMEMSTTAAISTDGTFTLSLEKTTDWLLMLINSTATGTGRFVGTLALNTGTDGLVALPATDSMLSTMSLGTINRPDGASYDALSTRVVTTGDFSLSAAQLATLAQNDDVFRNAMNIVNNYGTFGGKNGAYDIWYQLRPDFSWTGVSSELVTGTSPSISFKGVTFQLDTNSKNVTMSDICSGGSTTVALYPPDTLFSGMNTYDQTTPIISTGATCTTVNLVYQQANGTDFMATDMYAGTELNEGQMSFSFPADFQSAPAGEWIWQERGVVRGVFNINPVNTPYVPVSKTPKGFVPSFKINFVGATKQIESVDVKWYYYDGVGYTEVTPAVLPVLKHFISSFEVKFDVNSGGRHTCEMYFDPATTSTVRPSDFPTVGECSHPWYFNDNSNPSYNTGVMGFYESGGYGYFFHFFAIP